jgi:hypothetical protein
MILNFINLSSNIRMCVLGLGTFLVIHKSKTNFGLNNPNINQFMLNSFLFSQNLLIQNQFLLEQAHLNQSHNYVLFTFSINLHFFFVPSIILMFETQTYFKVTTKLCS